MQNAEAVPYVRIYRNTGEPIEEVNLMEFRLLYDGDLPGNGVRAKDKHSIRRQLHPQLRRMWQSNPRLRQYAANVGLKSSPDPIPDKNEEQRAEIGRAAIGKNFRRAGYNIVPLITEDLAVRCQLDVLLLRPQESNGKIFRGTDLDNQVKTLFDGMRMPDNENETGNSPPQSDEDPLFVLLEDDRLISEVHVIADWLLLRPHQVAIRETDAFAVIHVKLNHEPPRLWDNYFG